MDKIDMRLLEYLQKDGRLSIKDLAKKVSLTSPSVSARIKKMEQLGIIEGYYANLNHEKLGYPITAFIHLNVNPSQKPEFYAFVQDFPNIVECNCVTGEHNIMIKVIFPTTADLDTFIGVLQKYGATQTQIVFSTPVAPRGIQIKDMEKAFEEEKK